MTINAVTLGGRLGAKPMLSEFPGGDRKTSFSIAHSRFVGNGQYVTDWHNCFAKQHVADRLCEQAMKGQQITVQGSLRVTTYDNEAKGQKVVIVEIEVKDFMLGEPPKLAELKPDDHGG
jgi:single stranded DNA-binding protein